MFYATLSSAVMSRAYHRQGVRGNPALVENACRASHGQGIHGLGSVWAGQSDAGSQANSGRSDVMKRVGGARHVLLLCTPCSHVTRGSVPPLYLIAVHGTDITVSGYP